MKDNKFCFFIELPNRYLNAFVVLIFFCASSHVCLGQRSSISLDNIHTLTEDAAWCWFSDPRAVYYKGKKEAMYIGFINKRGDVVVKSIDLKTQETKEHILHKALQVDDHNVPTFLFLPDRRILTFYNYHNGNIYMRKSKKPENIDEWGEEVILLKQNDSSRYCYVNPVMLSNENNRIYLFGRNIVRSDKGTYSDTRMYCIYSDDYGETWSSEVNLLYNDERNNPQYVKYTSDNKSRIDFLFTNGHPKLGVDVSVHHMYYQDGYFRQTNGEKIGTLNELPVAIKNTNKIYDADKAGVRAWIWDIALDRQNNPVVTYARYPDEQNHEYYYATWDGKKWKDEKIVNSGPYITIIKSGKKLLEAHYSGGIVLNHNNPSEIYLSRKIKEKFEIEKIKIRKSGKRKTYSITRSSKVDNIRPYVLNGKSSGKPILLWMSGNYYHYTDYDTNIKLLIE